MKSNPVELADQTLITRASLHHADVLSILGAETFYQSHKNSAPPHEIDDYIKKVYSLDSIKSELNNPRNIYHIIEYKQKIAGFSKIIFEKPNPLIFTSRVTKLDQIYLDESHMGLGLGAKLLLHAIQNSKLHGDNGMWLLVWTHNHTAISVYEKFGFQIVTADKFQLTNSHQNPCYLMFLDYSVGK